MGGETPQFKIDHGDQPEPKDNGLISALMLLFGFTVLFPASALTVNSDLYIDIFGEHSGEQLLFLISLAITITSPFVQVLVAAFQHRVSYTSRIIVGFLFNTVLIAIFPFALLFLPTNIAFVASLLITFVIGINNSVLKMSSLSLASYYPSKMTHLLVRGKGYSPVIIILLKMLVKGIVDHFYADNKSKAIRAASTIIFVFAALFPTITAIVYRVARQTSLFSKYYFPNFRQRLILLQAIHDKDVVPQNIHPSLIQLSSNEEQEKLDFAGREKEEEELLSEMHLSRAQSAALLSSTSTSTNFNELSESDFTNNLAGSNVGDAYVSLNDGPGDSSGDSTTTITDEIEDMKKTEIQEVSVNKFVVLKTLTLPFSLIALCMFATYTIYPAVLIKPHSTINSLPSAWYRLILMLVFAVSDLLARSLPYSMLLKICPVRNVDLLTYTRILFIPFFFYSAYVENIASQITFLFTAVLGFTNGIVFVLVFRNYQHLLSDSQKSTGGALMSIAVVVGVLIGNIFSLVVDSVCTIK